MTMNVYAPGLTVQVIDTVAPPPPGTMPAWRKPMTALTWAKIGANVPADIDPEKNAAINPNYPNAAPWHGNGGFLNIMNAWSGGDLNRADDNLRINGGGHGDYYGNEILDCELNVDSPTWALFKKPTGCIGNTGDLDIAQVINYSFYFDGRERSAHTYNDLVFDDSGNYYNVLGAVSGSGNSGRRVVKYKPDGTMVDLGATPAGLSTYGGLCWDSLRKMLYYSTDANGQLYAIDPNTGVWTNTGKWNGNSGRQRCVYLPAPYDVVVAMGAYYTRGFKVYDYGRTAGDMLAPPCTGTPPSQTMGTGVWVPSLNAIVQWQGSTGFNLLTPPAGNPATGTWAWSRLECAVGNSVTPDTPLANGVLGRFFHSPNLNVLGVITAVDKQVNVFALG